ncbi:MAG TPA: hypothetical protein VFX39_07215 [Gemmatimonadaceae bacterium]|nr:hypothetical protein [Gemmatimonadaceae bacterium]
MVSPLDRLTSLRRALSLALGARAALTGVATGVLVFVAFALVEWMRPGALGAMSRAAPLVIAVAAAVLAAAYVRMRAGRLTERRVALWVEERVPGLDFALVTAADPRHRALVPSLAPRLSGVPWGALGRRAAARALALPALAAVIATLALVLVVRPPDVLVRGAARGTSGAGGVAPSGARATLTVSTATVRPPSYTGWRSRSISDPSSVAALAGSVVELSGASSGRASATMDVRAGAANARARELPLAADGDQWRVRFEMPDEPAVVRMASGDLERLVVLEPQPDSAPVVSFAPSVRDTVLREPRGAIALAADARDDVGLASSGFEWIVSSGEGESYTFRQGVVGAATHRGARTAAMRASLALDALALKPGDVVHVRAVARDGNTRSGPGLGASETRVVRIARAGEYDSLAVEAAPPAALDTAALSQRMLLVRTERLEARRARMQRAAMLAEARDIATDQTRLRKQVGEMVYMRLGETAEGEHSHFPGDGHEHGQEGKIDANDLLARASAATDIQTEATDFHGDETPVVAVNKPLLEAYNHMWDATRALEVGEPGRAIPPMRLALAALQRAREAERIYLRGRPPAVVVDVARARLAGKERGTDGVRRPNAPLDEAAAERLRRLDRALLLRARDAAAAADTLQLLRADVLRTQPAVARALGEAVDALRAGGDAATPLARARRLMAGTPEASAGLPRWGGVQ